MFNCGLCHKTSQEKEKAFRVVVEKAPATYPVGWHPPSNGRVNPHPDGSKDPGGVGWRVVKEVLAHQSCRDKFLTEEQKQQKIELEATQHGNANGATEPTPSA